MVTLSPPTSEARVRFKWESWYLLAVGRQFTVQNPDELYVQGLISQGHLDLAKFLVS